MKKKDKKQTTNQKQPKNPKKEKKQKDPKEYIPPNLLPNLRQTQLITCEINDEENDQDKNSSQEYKPEFIPCTIPEEWTPEFEEEINNEININNNNNNDQEKIENKKEIKPSKQSTKKKVVNDQKITPITKNKNSNEVQQNESEESESEKVEIDPEILKKFNHIIKYEDDSDRFIDPDDQLLKDNLPLYLVDILRNEIKWKRPKKYILHYFLWEKVKISFPKKKIASICDEIIETYKDYLLKIINGDGIKDESDDEKNLDDYLSNKTGEIKTRIYREYYPIIDKEYPIKIANFFSRQETDEEFLKRKELEEKNINKKDKNKKKDINKIIDEKIMIKELNASNLRLNNSSNFQNSFYTWLTSLFQFIFDNNITDINTKKSILFNIYPQKDGIPIYNPRGKYAIKMYLMGKERKIIIDDTIPFSNEDEFIFPGGDNLTEIWPVLFTKALIKLNIYKYRHPYYYKEEEFTDISYIYNLTGKHVFCYNWNDVRLHNLLNIVYNENIQNYNTKFVFGFFKAKKTKSMKITQLYQSYDERINELNNRLLDKEKNKHLIPLLQSINSGLQTSKKAKPKIKFKEDFQSPQKKFVAGFPTRRREKKFGTLHYNDPKTLVNSFKVQSEKLIDDGIVVNFLYSLSDYFESKNYNMRRTKKVYFDDIRVENEETKWGFKQLNLNEKREYMIRRREIKIKHNEEREKRINALKNIPKENEYQLYKIYSHCENLPNDYKNFDLYNDKEITMARKCLANNWDYPPMEFFEFDEEPEIPESMEKLNGHKDSIASKLNNEAVKNYKKEKKDLMLYGWTLENFKDLCGDKYIEEKKLDVNNIKIVRKSSDKIGIWLENLNMQKYFNKILVVFNDTDLYKNNLLCDNAYYNYMTDDYEPVEEYQAFYLIDEEENEEEETKFRIDLIFQPFIEQLYKHVQPKVYLMPYINLDIYEKETQSKIYSKITLNQFYSSFDSDKFIKNNSYYIIITDGYYPMGYTINVISNKYSIKNMTRNKFYQQILNYKTQEFSIDFPDLEKNQIWMFGKILITNNNPKTSTIKFKLNISYQIKKIIPFIHVYLEDQDINIKRREIMLDEFVTLIQNNTEEIKSKNYITILIKPEHLIKSDTIDIEILYDNEEYIFELLDTVPPYEISGEDTSESHMNGGIFSEYIYPSENEVVSCIDLKIRKKTDEGEILIEKGIIDFSLELYQLIKEPNINFEMNSIHFSYSNIGHLIKKWNFYNDITLSNIVFNIKKSNPKDEPQISDDRNSDKNKIKKPKTNSGQEKEQILPYVLICYVNDRFNNKFSFENIKWNIKVFSDNTISFVKDISKTSHEEKIKEDWETNQPGRKLLASDSRKRYLLFEKKNNGLELSKEEKQFLSVERKRNIIELNKEILDKNPKNKNKKQKIGKNAKNGSSNVLNQIFDGNVNNNFNSLCETPTMQYTKINKLPIIHSRHFLDVNQFKMNRILQSNKIDNNKCHSLYVTNYMNYINKNRVIHYEGLNKNISVLDKELIDQFNKKINNEFNESEKIIKQDNYFVKSKDDLDDVDDKNFNKFLNKFGKVRIRASDSMKNLITKRNFLNRDLIEKIKTENKIKDIIENKDSWDLDKIIKVYESAKEILPSDYESFGELERIIEIKKEEQASKIMNSSKSKNKKK